MLRRLLGLGVVLATGLPAQAWEPPQVELGVENLSYGTGTSPLNRDNVLGLDRIEDLLRGSLSLKGGFGTVKLVARGFVERRIGSADATTTTLRQAYAQVALGDALTLRLGKQRIAWGSGLAWNPTNRLEPPKNPLNTSLEQEGSWAVRMDLVPAAWAGLTIVAARDDASPADLPFETEGRTRRSGAVRARFLVKDTDLALVVSGGKNARSLVGFDVARSAGGSVTLHAEGAAYSGAEAFPPRDDETFFRLAAGLLYLRGEGTAVSLEYFWNGEGYDDAEAAAYLQGLEASYAQAQDPRLPAPARDAALTAYLTQAAVPYSGGLGLRRHYLHASWTRTTSDGRWTLAGRGTAGLSDGGMALVPGVAFAPRGDVTLQVDGVVFLGPEDSEYRWTPVSGAVQARLKVMF